MKNLRPLFYVVFSQVLECELELNYIKEGISKRLLACALVREEWWEIIFLGKFLNQGNCCDPCVALNWHAANLRRNSRR
jgi:hypothetical protein